MDGDGRGRRSSPSQGRRWSEEALGLPSCCGVAERWAVCGWPLSILSGSPCPSARAWGLRVAAAAHGRTRFAAQGEVALLPSSTRFIYLCGGRALWGLLWLQTQCAGGLGSKQGPGSRSVCFVDAAEQCPWAGEGWGPVPAPCGLGDGSGVCARAPSRQTPSPSAQRLPPLCPQLPTEGPCPASTPSPAGSLCP